MKPKFNDAGYRQLREAVAHGFLRIGEEVLASADVPDAPPYGVGLVKRGATGAWVEGQKVGGAADAPSEVDTSGVVGVVGYGFPARFQEMGTVHQPARPFLTPAVMAVQPRAGDIIVQEVKARIGGLR